MSLCTLVFVFAAVCGAYGEGLQPETLLKTFLSEPYSHLQVLGEVSDVPGILVRTFASPAHKRAARLLSKWMTEAGLHTWIDALGNVHGTLPGQAASAGQLVIGSHYDTVVDGGKYDGQLGIVVGIAAVKSLILQELQASGRLDALANILGTQNVSLPNPLQDTVASVQGLSAAVASKTCQGGLSFSPDCAAAAKLLDSPTDILDSSLSAGLANSSAFPKPEHPSWLHPLVEDIVIPHSIAKTVLQRPVHIVGFADEEGARFSSTFLGSRALVGTFLKYGALDSKDENGTTLAEVLRQQGWKDPITTIASLALDADNIDAYVEVHIEQVPHLADAVMCDEDVTQQLMDSIQGSSKLMQQIGVQPPTSKPATAGGTAPAPPLLVSGAGHDAMAIAEVSKIGMMFVRCRGGVSHSPLEHVEPEDVGAATAALSTFLQKRLL